MQNWINRYRQLYRPSSDKFILDTLPVIPPQREDDGWAIRRDFRRRIAWAKDMLGDEDNVPSMVFIGAGYTLIKSVMTHLRAALLRVMTGFRVYETFYPYQRQGRAWVRVAVELRGLNESIMTADDVMTIIIRNVEKTCWCSIRQVKIDTLLNM